MKRWPRLGSNKEIDVKKLVLFALIAMGVSFSAIHKPQASTVDAAGYVALPAPSPAAPPAKADDLPFDPSEFMSLIMGDKDKTPDNVECSKGAKYCTLSYRFDGDVNEKTTKAAIEFLKKADEAKPQRIMLEINTHGGSLDAGMELVRQIEETKAEVVCVVDGNALSMGYFMLQSCPVRAITARSVLMSHQVLFMQVAPGTIAELKKAANTLDVDSKAIAWQGQHRLKISMKEYLDRVNDKTWYFESDEAFGVGAVDCVVNGTATDARKSLENSGDLVCSKGTSKLPGLPDAKKK